MMEGRTRNEEKLILAAETKNMIGLMHPMVRMVTNMKLGIVVTSLMMPVFAVCQSNDTVEVVQEGETIIRGDPSSVDSVLALLDMPELEIVRGNVSTGVVYGLKTELFPFRKCMLREFAKKDRLPYAYCSSGFGWQIQELCSSNVVEGMSFGQAEFKLAEVRDYLVDALKGRAIKTGVAKNEYSILSQEKTIGHWEVNLSFTRQGDDKVLFTLRIFREPYVSPVKPKTDASDQIEVEI